MKEAETELFSQSARLHRAVEGKWELEGDGDAKLFHNSVTGLSRFIFAFEHNLHSARTLWFSASSNVRFQGLLREIQ